MDLPLGTLEPAAYPFAGTTEGERATTPPAAAAPAVRTGTTTVDAAVPGQVLTINETGQRETYLAPPAPRRPVMGQPSVPAQALAGLGVESGGTYYPEDFGARLREAVDTGKLKPAQAAMQVAKYREWLSSPEGLMTQGAREQVAAAQDLGAIAVAEQSVAAEQQKKTAELYNQASQQIADQEAEWQGLREEYAKNQAQRMAEMDALTTEIQNTRIDPSNYWKNQGALGAALSVIGLALGAYVQGRSMGQVPNLALGELNKAIDRDIDAQKANLDIKGKALEAQRGIYGLVRQRLGDDQAAMDYTRGLMKENLANSVAEFAARSGTEKAKLAATEVVTKLRADAAKTINDVRLRLSVAERDRLARQAQARAVAAARPKLTDYRPLDAKDQERYVPQLRGLAGNAKTAETARIGIDSYDKAIEKLEKMKKLRLEGNTGGFSTDAATYDALQSSVTFDMKNATEAGALDKGLVEVLQSMVPKSALFSWDENAARALDETKAILKTEKQKLIDRTVVQPFEIVNTPAGLFGRATGGRSLDTLTLKKVEE